MNKIKTICLVTLFASSTHCMAKKPLKEQVAKFKQLISQADRIVIRAGGFDCCENTKIDEQKIILEIKELDKVQEFSKNINLKTDEEGGLCDCCGFPGVDWYKGDKRIVLTSIKHGHAIRWKGFEEDISFTVESENWVKAWLKGLKNKIKTK